MKKGFKPATTPFSTLGVEHSPLFSNKTECPLVIHEWGYLPNNSDWDFSALLSPFWRLYYNEGEGHCLSSKNDLIHLGPERLVLVPPHCLVQGIGRPPVDHFWVHFSYSKRLSDPVPRPVELVPEVYELALIQRLKKLRSLQEKPCPTEQDLLLSKALLLSVLSSPELRWLAPQPQNFLKLTEHIARHFASPLKNADLAKIAGMSTAGLARHFNHYLGVSPARYVLTVRISEATALLRHTTETIEEISEKTGFSNRNHFSHIFKKITGHSPAEFRRIHKKSRAIIEPR